MIPEELEAIRKRDVAVIRSPAFTAEQDRRALLAEVDRLTKALATISTSDTALLDTIRRRSEAKVSKVR